MTITVGGYAGAMTEAQWAQAHAIPPCTTGGDASLAPTAVAGARAVTIAAGTAAGRGLAITNDAAVQVNFATPATGGQWWLVVLRRTYSPTATAAVVAVAGGTTAGTVAPTLPPATFPALNSNPGVVEDQPLGWVWVSSASTTVAVFDARLVQVGSTVVAMSPWTLNAHVAANTFVRGAVVGMRQWTNSTGNSAFRASTWKVSNSPAAGSVIAYPLEPLVTQLPQGLTDLAAGIAGYANIGLLAGVTRGFVESNGTTYLFVGAGLTALGANAATSAWQAWSKPAADCTPPFQNVTWPSPAWTAKYGITEGTLWMDLFVAAVGAVAMVAGQEFTMTLPSPAVGNLGIGQGAYAVAGSTANNNLNDLMAYPVGTAGQASTSLRLRVKVASAAGASVKDNLVSSAITPGTNDWLMLSFRGASGAVA